MMKLQFLRFTFGLMIALLSTGLHAQVTAEGDTVVDRKKRAEVATQTVLERVLKYAGELKYDSFGKIMAYTGRDPNRNLRTAINPIDPHERLEIENTCNFLEHLLSKSALHHAKNFRVVKGAFGDLFFWDVEFTMLNGKTKNYVFMFVELDGKYLFCSAEKA